MVKYVHFDFHKECSKMRWHRLQILMDRLRDDIQEQSYYLATADGTVLQRQVRITREISQILMEHIDIICRVESKLQIMSICSIKIFNPSLST